MRPCSNDTNLNTKWVFLSTHLSVFLPWVLIVSPIFLQCCCRTKEPLYGQYRLPQQGLHVSTAFKISFKTQIWIQPTERFLFTVNTWMYKLETQRVRFFRSHFWHILYVYTHATMTDRSLPCMLGKSSGWVRWRLDACLLMCTSEILYVTHTHRHTFIDRRIKQTDVNMYWNGKVTKTYDNKDRRFREINLISCKAW